MTQAFSIVRDISRSVVRNVSVSLGSAPAPWSPGDLGATLLTWLEADPAYLFQDSAGTTPVTADTNPVGLVNAKGGSVNATQATSSARPLYRTGAGLPYLQHDGSDDTLLVGLTPPDANVYFLIRTADTVGCLISNNATSRYAGLWQLASTTTTYSPDSGDPVAVVDGVEHLVRQDLAAAIATGDWVVAEVRGLDASNWVTTVLGLLRYPAGGYGVAGDLAAVIITDASTETTQDRDDIRAYLQGLIP